MAALAFAMAAILAVALVVREVALHRRLSALREEMAQLRTESAEAEQLASLGQLVSGLAQELKSPLQGVIGNAELMLAAGTHAASGEELRTIQENATRAAAIVRNLLAFTETSAIVRRWQDMNEIVRRGVEYSRGELAVLGVRVTEKPGDRVPLVYVDGRQLERVVSALLLRKTSRPLSRDVAIVVSTFRSSQDDRLVIEINDRAAADTGDELAWSPDLAACRQILVAHGGSLDVSYPSAGGTLFHLELPLAATVLASSTGSEPHG